MQSHHLNTLVIIVPGGAHFVDGGIDSMFNPYGYSVLNQHLCMLI